MLQSLKISKSHILSSVCEIEESKRITSSGNICTVNNNNNKNIVIKDLDMALIEDTFSFKFIFPADH